MNSTHATHRTLAGEHRGRTGMPLPAPDPGAVPARVSGAGRGDATADQQVPDPTPRS